MSMAIPQGMRLLPGKVLLQKDKPPGQTYSGLYLPETMWQHDPNFATVIDTAWEGVQKGARVCYYGWAQGVHLDDRQVILDRHDLIADVTGIQALTDIRPLNEWCAILLKEPDLKSNGGIYMPDTVYRPLTGVILTGRWKGFRTVFRGPEGIHFRGDIEGVRFGGVVAFVKEAAIKILIEDTE